MNFSFVQNQPGVLSGILQSLWKNRKLAKKEMNATNDPFVKTVLNAKQLAIKVSMNSIYGFTGATVGALPCLEISQSVTGCGRLMIEQTQYHAKEMFGCEIVYGDSVSSDTPILIKRDSIVQVISISSLFNKYLKRDYPQFKPGEPGVKEQVDMSFSYHPEYMFVEVWTSSGWKNIRRIVRHFCNKKMYKI
jgi:DNA polymerase elongation subunit (family B)